MCRSLATLITLLSLTISWVLAAGIRRLPGFRAVL